MANETGAYQVTAHLADAHGYTDICFIAGPPDSPDSGRRLDGFQRATAGLAGLRNEVLVYYGDFTTAGGRRVAERIIAGGRVPRALVCANDQTAIGVMAALQHAGLSVPGDVAVTGFDGIRLGRHLRPGLTTVVQPMAALGDTAVTMLKDRIGGPPSGSRRCRIGRWSCPSASSSGAAAAARNRRMGGQRRQRMSRARRYWRAAVMVVVVALLAPGYGPRVRVPGQPVTAG